MSNAPLHVMCNSIKKVVSSAVEAQTGDVFLGAQRGCPICVALFELGHTQPAAGTPIYIDVRK